VGAELRKNMLWGDDTDPDTASNWISWKRTGAPRWGAPVLWQLM